MFPNPLQRIACVFSIASQGTKIRSAGSEPIAVRPETIAVLQEISVDIGGQRLKSVAEVPADEVDLVVTLLR